MAFFKLRSFLTLDTTQFTSGMTKATRAATKASAGLGRELDGISKRFTRGMRNNPLLSGALAIGAFQAGRAFVDMAGKVQDLADETGLSTTTISELGYVFSQAGIETEVMTTALQKLAVKVSDARGGNKAAMKTFEDLGISMDAIAQLPLDQAFSLVVQGLSKVQDANLQTALTTDLFGAKNTRMLRVIKQGAKGIEDGRAAARRYGIALGEDAVAGADRLGDSVSTLYQSVQSLFGVFTKSSGLDKTFLGIASGIGKINKILENSKLAAFLVGTAGQALFWSLALGTALRFVGFALKGLTVLLKIPGIKQLVGWLVTLGTASAGAGAKISKLGAFFRGVWAAVKFLGGWLLRLGPIILRVGAWIAGLFAGGTLATIGLWVGAVVSVGVAFWKFGRALDNLVKNSFVGKWIDALFDKMIRLKEFIERFVGSGGATTPQLGERTQQLIDSGKLNVTGTVNRISTASTGAAAAQTTQQQTQNDKLNALNQQQLDQQKQQTDALKSIREQLFKGNPQQQSQRVMPRPNAVPVPVI